MGRLTELPSELLLLLFSANESIQTASRLARASRKLHEIWAENSSLIVTEILQQQVPACSDAISLAVAETAATGPSNVPHLWVPRLLQNTELASSACTKFREFLDGLPKENYRHNLRYPSLHASYYIIRQLVLAYSDPRLRPALRSKLEATPMETMRTHDELCFFMCEFMDDEEQVRQGMPKDKKDWIPEDELSANVNKDEWGYAADTLREVLQERRQAEKELECK